MVNPRAVRKIMMAVKEASRPGPNQVDLSTIDTYEPMSLYSAYREVEDRFVRSATKVFNEEIARRYPDVKGKFVCWVYVKKGAPVLACGVKRRYAEYADEILDVIEDALYDIEEKQDVYDRILENM